MAPAALGVTETPEQGVQDAQGGFHSLTDLWSFPVVGLLLPPEQVDGDGQCCLR